MTVQRYVRSALPFLLFVAGVAAAVWPQRVLLPMWPMTMDGTLWVSKSAISRQGWWKWDLFSSHFIGYRPVTALSFTFDSVLGGTQPFWFHVTDIAVYAATALVLWLLARRLMGPWTGLLAAAVFLLHPGVQEILPYFSRRSYLLSAFLSTAALLPFLDAVRDGRMLSRPAVWTALLTCLSIGANEEGFVMLPAMVVLALWKTDRAPRAALRPLVVTSLLALGALVARLVITGDLGGYGHALPGITGAAKIVGNAALHLVAPPPSDGGDAALYLGGVGPVLSIAGILGWACVVPLLRLRRRAPTGLALPMLVWLSGYVLLSLLTGAWYSRQVWPALIALSLLMAAIVHDGADDTRVGTRLLRLLPAFWVIASLAMGSPLLRGMEADRVAAMQAQQDRVDTAYTDIRALPDAPSLVYLVTPIGDVPGWDRGGTGQVWYHGQRTSSWLRTLLKSRKKQIKDIAFILPRGGDSTSVRGRYEVKDGRPAFIVPHAARVFSPKGDYKTQPAELPSGEKVIWLDTLPSPRKGARYLYFFEGTTGNLVALPDAPAAK